MNFRRCFDVVRRFHDQPCRGDHDLDLAGAVRQIVSLLRTRPQLVLDLNALLPDGYRIRMYDRSGYVIEFPDDVGGVGTLTVAV